MPIICPPPLSEIPTDAMPPVRDEWDYTPLPKPIPITEQRWPKGTRPLVTVRCITFNHEAFIRQAIDGFLMQETTFPVQILVHDDASTDGTAAIVREYAEKYPDLIVAVLQPENLFSKGVRPDLGPLQFGRYLAFCEGDDYWITSDKLQRQVAILEENPKCVLVGARSYLWRDGDPSPYAIDPGIPPEQVAALGPADFFARGPWMHNATRVWKSSFLDGFMSDVPPGPCRFDLGQALYTTAAALRGEASIRMLDSVTSVYRKHPGGIYSGSTAVWNASVSAQITSAMVRFFPPGQDRRQLALQAAQWLVQISHHSPNASAADRVRWACRAASFSKHRPIFLLRQQARFAKHLLKSFVRTPSTDGAATASVGVSGKVARH